MLYTRNFLQRADVISILEANIQHIKHPLSASTCPAPQSEYSTGETINIPHEMQKMREKAFLYNCDENFHCRSDELSDCNTKNSFKGIPKSENSKGINDNDEEGDDDDLTFQLTKMLRQMDTEFSDLLNSFSEAPRNLESEEPQELVTGR